MGFSTEYSSDHDAYIKSKTRFSFYSSSDSFCLITSHIIWRPIMIVLRLLVLVMPLGGWRPHMVFAIVMIMIVMVGVVWLVLCSAQMWRSSLGVLLRCFLRSHPTVPLWNCKHYYHLPMSYITHHYNNQIINLILQEVLYSKSININIISHTVKGYEYGVKWCSKLLPHFEGTDRQKQYHNLLYISTVNEPLTMH